MSGPTPLRIPTLSSDLMVGQVEGRDMRDISKEMCPVLSLLSPQDTADIAGHLSLLSPLSP